MTQPDQPSLFDPPPRPPRAVARKTDPETSWEAADKIDPDQLTKAQTAVLNLFRQLGDMADFELEAAADRARLPISPSGLRTRRSELVTKGFLVFREEWKTIPTSGNRARIWGTK